jgi:hypothetical protein
MKYYRKLFEDTVSTKDRGNISLEIREYPPTRRTVWIDHTKYRLQIPHQIFTHCSGILYFRFALEPIKTTADKVYFSPLPNIYDYTRVCLGDNFPGGDMNDKIDYYWNSEFRTRSLSAGPYAAGVCFGSYGAWGRLSLERAKEKIVQANNWSHLSSWVYLISNYRLIEIK